MLFMQALGVKIPAISSAGMCSRDWCDNNTETPPAQSGNDEHREVREVKGVERII